MVDRGNYDGIELLDVEHLPIVFVGLAVSFFMLQRLDHEVLVTIGEGDNPRGCGELVD